MPVGSGDQATRPRTRAAQCLFSLTVIVCVRETGLPPSEDWKVKLAVTRRPFFCLRAFLRAFSADGLGRSLKSTTPAATDAVPRAKTTFDGRHLPASRTKPDLHLLLDANTPNLPFWKVSSQLNLPEFVIDSTNVTFPVAASKELAPAVNLLLGSGSVSIGPPGRLACRGAVTIPNDCCASGAGPYSPLPTWFASIVQVPAASKLTLEPRIEHVAALAASTDSATGSPEDALVLTE